jgi:hypothetical protein
MAFKKTPPKSAVPDSPEQILLDLPRRKIPGVLLHQGEVLRAYRTSAVDEPDVALQLPTGSGKTLVGLLVAEWRRRKFGERVVYLCPTKQLVNQVVEQADEQYGLSVTGFTGASSGYDPASKAEYKSAERIAVTTYSSLFNTKPFFADPQAIVVDDAHAAENYISELWTVRIDRKDFPALHAAVCSVLAPVIELTDSTKITGRWQSPGDSGWCNKLGTPQLAKVRAELIEVLDSHVPDTKLYFPWSMIRDHVHACHLYLGFKELLLRPLLPPTWAHAPFENAKQRIYMSATLGEGGDLERVTGRKKIKRLAVPQGWDKQGIGRRFFIFPGMSLKETETTKLRHDLMKIARRSLVLVPSDKAETAIAADVKKALGFPIFSAESIEISKKPFVEAAQAVAVVANRYDGIDFPGDDCRLLFIEGLPRATNLQEQFLMSRMGAAVLYNERVLTRVVQAVGRCTRSLVDYSAVVVVGEELTDYLIDQKRRVYMHPEMQAELAFGIEQSRGSNSADIAENLSVFLEHKKAWEEANEDVVQKRGAATQSALPAMADLAKIVQAEIEYQTELWNGNYEGALASAETVLAGLNDSALRGYRALWHYLAGSAAWLGSQAAIPTLAQKARSHFSSAYEAARFIPWLLDLARHQPDVATGKDDKRTLLGQIEKTEMQLTRLGTVHERAYAQEEAEILNGLLNESLEPEAVRAFEDAHMRLGKLLGFDAGKVEGDATPDPWWAADTDFCIVFEDHSGAQPSSSLDATKARQAATHPNWVKQNLPTTSATEILSVLVSPVKTATEGALPHLPLFSYWSLQEFRSWAKNALAVIRKLRRTYAEPGDPDWREAAIAEYEAHNMAVEKLFEWLRARPASDFLKRE